jgi:hypothetical protein
VVGVGLVDYNHASMAMTKMEATAVEAASTMTVKDWRIITTDRWKLVIS